MPGSNAELITMFSVIKKDNTISLLQKLGNFIYNSSQSHATYFNEYNTKLAKKKKKASLHFLTFLQNVD